MELAAPRRFIRRQRFRTSRFSQDTATAHLHSFAQIRRDEDTFHTTSMIFSTMQRPNSSEFRNISYSEIFDILIEDDDMLIYADMLPSNSNRGYFEGRQWLLDSDNTTYVYTGRRDRHAFLSQILIEESQAPDCDLMVLPDKNEQAGAKNVHARYCITSR